MALPTSPDDPAPEQTSVKIVIGGGFGVGKTTFVGAVSEIPPVDTDAWMTQVSRNIDPLHGNATKTKTTVAMDFGRITFGNGIVLYLFGTLGQPRFMFMWEDLARGASAAIVLVDTRDLEKSYPAVNYFENDCDVPFLVAVNLFDGHQPHPIDEVREALRLDDAVPLLTCDARDRASAARALIAAVEHTHNLARSGALLTP